MFDGVATLPLLDHKVMLHLALVEPGTLVDSPLMTFEQKLPLKKNRFHRVGFVIVPAWFRATSNGAALPDPLYRTSSQSTSPLFVGSASAVPSARR